MVKGTRIEHCMRNLAVIPARSGSKGLKNKNIRMFAGKPLMAYTIESAINSNQFECVHVSTDSLKYADIARQYGADVPFLRSEKLSTDEAGTWDTVRFVTNEYLRLGNEFDTVTVLQPTSPLRTAGDIIAAFHIFEKKGAEAVVSVCETEYLPLLCNVLPENGSLNNFVDLNIVGRRQQSQQFYRINGAIYIQSVDLLMRKGELYGEKSFAYIMAKGSSIDIDDDYDFTIAELLLLKRLNMSGRTE